MSHRLSRRRFLQASAAAGAFGYWPAARAADAAKVSSSERLRVGVIGVAAQGAYNLQNIAAAGAEIVALCDVDENRALKAREAHPKATFYIDYRNLIEHPGLDAVAISTPDHTHAVATVAALHNGLHVYCEKPLTRTVSEARIVTETAAKQRRVTQMGTQIHAGSNYRRVVELVQAGAVGPIREVHVWVSTSYTGERPKDTPPVPETLHYDLWLGPAPYRPYHPSFVPFFWRAWWDFGGGALADMACHYMDLPHWALHLRQPTKVAAEGPPVHPESAPAWAIVQYEYPARGDLPPVKLTWYHGGKRPAAYAEQLPKWGGGVLFVGDKGLLVANYNEHKLLPQERFAGYQPPPKTIPDSVGHHREWVEACRSGSPTTCNFDYAGALTEAVLLGNVAYRLGRPITWDAKNLRAVNDPEADRYLHHEYRKGWSL